MVEMLYARYEIVGGQVKYQLLINHLLGTRQEMIKCIGSRTIRHVVESLVRNEGIGFKEIAKAAEIAALFHDIGKALQYYQGRIEKVKKEGTRLSFPYHEVMSSYILASAFQSLATSPLTPPWLCSLVIQAVLLHHQGLRVLDLEALSSYELKKIVQTDATRSASNLQKICMEITKHNSISKESKVIAEEIAKISRDIVVAYDPSIILQYYDLKEEDRVKLSRIISGCLMIADVKDAYKAVGDIATRYVKDIVKLKY